MADESQPVSQGDPGSLGEKQVGIDQTKPLLVDETFGNVSLPSHRPGLSSVAVEPPTHITITPEEVNVQPSGDIIITEAEAAHEPPVQVAGGSANEDHEASEAGDAGKEPEVRRAGEQLTPEQLREKYTSQDFEPFAQRYGFVNEGSFDERTGPKYRLVNEAVELAVDPDNFIPFASLAGSVGNGYRYLDGAQSNTESTKITEFQFERFQHQSPIFARIARNARAWGLVGEDGLIDPEIARSIRNHFIYHPEEKDIQESDLHEKVMQIANKAKTDALIAPEGEGEGVKPEGEGEGVKPEGEGEGVKPEGEETVHVAPPELPTVDLSQLSETPRPIEIRRAIPPAILYGKITIAGTTGPTLARVLTHIGTTTHREDDGSIRLVLTPDLSPSYGAYIITTADGKLTVQAVERQVTRETEQVWEDLDLVATADNRRGDPEMTATMARQLVEVFADPLFTEDPIDPQALTQVSQHTLFAIYNDPQILGAVAENVFGAFPDGVKGDLGNALQPLTREQIGAWTTELHTLIDGKPLDQIENPQRATALMTRLVTQGRSLDQASVYDGQPISRQAREQVSKYLTSLMPFFMAQKVEDRRVMQIVGEGLLHLTRATAKEQSQAVFASVKRVGDALVNASIATKRGDSITQNLPLVKGGASERVKTKATETDIAVNAAREAVLHLNEYARVAGGIAKDDSSFGWTADALSAVLGNDAAKATFIKKVLDGHSLVKIERGYGVNAILNLATRKSNIEDGDFLNICAVLSRDPITSEDLGVLLRNPSIRRRFAAPA